MRVTGRRTVTMDVLGIEEAYVIKRIFQIYHTACAGDHPTLFEFGLSPRSQEEIRTAMKTQYGPTFNFELINLLILTGHYAPSVILPRAYVSLNELTNISITSTEAFEEIFVNFDVAPI